MKISTLSMLIALAPLVIQPACAPDDSERGATTKVELTATASSALLGGSTVLWPMKDGKATVRVCWLPLDLGGYAMPGGRFAVDAASVIAERRQWVREGVERQWNARTVMSFVGWDDCGAAEADVEILPIGSNTDAQCTPDFDYVGGWCVQRIGSPGRGKRLFLNVMFGDEAVGQGRYLQTVTSRTVDRGTQGFVFRPSICGTQMDAAIDHFQNEEQVTDADIATIKRVMKDCLQNQSNHEFGHIAGFSHEQQRKDTSAACRARFDVLPSEPSDEDSPLGTFEADSIMSYCRTTLAPTLTEEDVEQTNAFYKQFAKQLPSAKPATDKDPSGTSTPDTSTTDKASTRAPANEKESANPAPERGGCNGN